MWDFGGAWPAYLIGVAWGLLLSVALLRAPEAEVAPREGEAGSRPPRFRARDALPRLSDYIGCFALMAIPAVVATMAIMLLRNATNSVQFSLYVVYLDGIGLTGTVIGILFAAVEIASGLGSLFAGRAMRLGRPAADDAYRHRAVDPVHLRDAVSWRHLRAAAAWRRLARGWLQGVVQPMMFSVQAKAVGRYRQGAVVGLRQTTNRLSSIVIPPVMGVIADWWGMTESFVVLGVFLLLLCWPILQLSQARLQRPFVKEAPKPT